MTAGAIIKKLIKSALYIISGEYNEPECQFRNLTTSDVLCHVADRQVELGAKDCVIEDGNKEAVRNNKSAAGGRKNDEKRQKRVETRWACESCFEMCSEICGKLIKGTF